MTQENHRTHSDHADSVFHHAQDSNSSKEWQGQSEIKIQNIGDIFGSTSNKKIIEALLDKVAKELGEVGAKKEAGEYRSATVQLNAFWDDYLEVAIETEIEEKDLKKQVCPSHGARIDQANSYDIIGDRLAEALSNLNKERHKPGHETWDDVDAQSTQFREALDQVYELTVDHFKHLEEYHC